MDCVLQKVHEADISLGLGVTAILTGAAISSTYRAATKGEEQDPAGWPLPDRWAQVKS